MTVVNFPASSPELIEDLLDDLTDVLSMQYYSGLTVQQLIKTLDILKNDIVEVSGG